MFFSMEMFGFYLFDHLYYILLSRRVPIVTSVSLSWRPSMRETKARARAGDSLKLVRRGADGARAARALHAHRFKSE